MKIEKSSTNLLISVAIICSFLGSGVSLGSFMGFSILPIRIIGIVSAIWVLVKGTTNRIYWLKVQYIITAYIYMVITTLLFSENYLNSITLLLDYMTLFSVFCIVLLNIKDNVEYKKYVNLYLICTILTIVICIYEFITHNHIASNYTQAYSTLDWAYSYTIKAPTAFLYNPNNVAVLMIISLPLFLEKINEKESSIKKVGWLVGTIFDFAVIFMTGSRGGLVAGGIIVFVYFMFSDIKWWKKLLLVMAIIIVMCYFSNFIFEQLGYGGMLLNGKINIFAGGDGGRSSIAKNSMEKVFKENPLFGLGAGSVENKNLIPSHNTMIEVLCNYGLLGFVLFCFLVFRLGKKVFYQKNKVISVLILLGFGMSMFIPPTIMTLHVLFIPVAFCVSKSYFERREC